MRKKFISLILLLLLVTLAFTVVACVGNNVEATYTLEQINPSGENLKIEQGSNKFSSIIFAVVKDGTKIDTVSANATMISAEDIAKLNTIGTYTITINYQSLQLRVTVTVVPKAEIITYNITYDAIDGVFEDSHTSVQLHNASIISVFPTPIKDGYTFSGWYFAKNYTGDKLITPYALSENTYVYAKWTDNRLFTVTFKNEDGTILQTYNDVEYGSSVLPPKPKEIVGKDFVGWDSDNYKNVKSTTEIRAVYSQKRLTITFYDAEKEVYREPKIFLYNETWDQPYPFPNKEGYDGKWIDRATGKAPVFTNIKVNMDIDAVYTIKTYSASFFVPKDYTATHEKPEDFEKFGEDNIRTAEYGKTIIVPVFPQKVGYNGYWAIYDQNGKFTQASTELAKPIKKNYVVYAVYTKQAVTLTYSCEGQTKVFNDYFYGDIIEAPYIWLNADGTEKFPSRYYDVKWYEDNQVNSKEISFPLTLKNNLTIFVVGTAKKLTVHFCMPSVDTEGNPIKYYDFSAGSILSTAYATKNSSVTPPAPTFAMYNVIGWENRGSNGDTINNITDFHEYNKDPALDTAFYAILEVKTFTVSFYNQGNPNDTEDSLIITENGKYPMESIKYDTIFKDIPAENSVIKPSYPSGAQDQFEFDGWYTKEGKKVDFEADVNNTIQGNSKFYAKWVDKLKGTEGLIYTKYTDDSGEAYAITGFVNENGANAVFTTLYIPREYNGLPVKKIASGAFDKTNKITIQYIAITENITIIEDNAFNTLNGFRGFIFAGYVTLFVNEVVQTSAEGDITVLYNADKTVLIRFPTVTINAKGFVIPDSVTTIAGSAFAMCKLTDITFKQDSSALTIIKEDAFMGMQTLKQITLPNSLVTIQKNAFMGCLSLTSINISADNSALMNVADGALNDTAWWNDQANNKKYVRLANVLVKFLDTNVNGTYVVEDSIVSIADKAFNISNLALNITRIEFTQNSKIVKFGKNVFESCIGLKDVVILANRKVAFDATTFEKIQVDAKLTVLRTLHQEYLNDTNITNYFKETNIIANNG